MTKRENLNIFTHGMAKTQGCLIVHLLIVKFPSITTQGCQWFQRTRNVHTHALCYGATMKLVCSGYFLRRFSPEDFFSSEQQ